LSSNTVSNNGSGAESETLSYYYEAFSYNGNVYDDDLWGACSGQGLNAYTSDFNEVWGMICADNSTIWNVSTVMDAGVTAEGFDFVFLDYSGSLLSIFFPKNLYGSKAAFEDPVTGTGIPVDVFVNNALIYDNDDDGVLDKSFYWDSDNAVIEPEGATFDNDVASFIAMTTVIEYTYADLYLSSSDSNSFSNGTLSALENGVKLDGDSTGNTITDSVISSSLGSDITSSSTGTNTFDNTTYSTYNVTAGTIDVNYDVRVNVTDNGSNNLQGATVTTTDTNSNDTDLGTTDSSGLTSYTSLDAYQIDSTGVINNKNDYTFSASHSSYDSTNTDQTVTLNSQNQNVTIALNQTLTLTAPNGGEEMDGDSVQSITWTSTGVIANVKLEYSTDGSNYTTIVASTTNDGSYSWTVPYISADTVTVRVSDASDSSFNDVSDASFIISSGGRYIPPNNGGGNSGGTTTPPADEEEDEDEEEETTEEESDTETGDESGSHHDQDSDDQSETEDDDSAEATIGDLVKVEDSSTVYQIGQDGQRHVFPDEKTYFSHYSDFSQVKTVPLTELQQYPLGDNITHKAGSLVKLMTVPKVYLVEGANTLRWIINESIFHALGYTFDLVNDLADSLFSNYQLGEDISG